MIKCYWADKEIEFKPFKYPAGEDEAKGELNTVFKDGKVYG